MAYVAKRRNGRFEIRESVHTADGPRARSLASFETLSDDVLAKAAARATRPFDRESVLVSGRRAGVRIAATASSPGRTKDPAKRFVASSQRMARRLKSSPRPRVVASPGQALIDLLGFVDAATASQPARAFQPLTFPVLWKIAVERTAAASLA
jgi:hypothetical protein